MDDETLNQGFHLAVEEKVLVAYPGDCFIFLFSRKPIAQ